jgi:hypothetical protein
MLYSFAFCTAQRTAQRASSTAAGASATLVGRYSTLMAFHPIWIYGSRLRTEFSFFEARR